MAEPSAQPGNEGNQDFRFGLRDGVPEDLEFVADSWRRSYDGNHTTRCPGGLREYIVTQQQVIRQCLLTSRVLVAYPEAPDRVPEQIMGWICHRWPVVHYVYVKASFRRAGIAKALLAEAAGGALGSEPIYTSHAFLYRLRGDAKYLNVLFNPALIFGGTE